MTSVEHSLLGHLDAPVLVGDPDGQAVYANPAFERRFRVLGEEVIGRPLSELFEGGGREAVLAGVARACEAGETARFPVREGGVGYAAVASPIVARQHRVGVIILLQEEIEGVERLIALHREMTGPLEELTEALDGLFEQTGGRRAVQYRSFVEDGIRALSRLRRGIDEIASALKGDREKASHRFDPASVVRKVMEKGREEAGAATRTVLLAPSSLPATDGDPDRLAWALSQMMELRLSRNPARLALGARRVEGPQGQATLISFSESFDEGEKTAPASDPPEVLDALAFVGAELHVASDPRLGRATLVRLVGEGA